MRRVVKRNGRKKENRGVFCSKYCCNVVNVVVKSVIGNKTKKVLNVRNAVIDKDLKRILTKIHLGKEKGYH